jgi:hypothetical protein
VVRMRAFVVVVTDIFAVVGVAALRFAKVVVAVVVVFGVLVGREDNDGDARRQFEELD